MKERKMVNHIGFLSKFFVIILIQSCLHIKTNEEQIEETSWYLKKTIVHFPHKDSIIIANVSAFSTIVRLRKNGFVERCVITVDSGIVCKPFKRYYDDIVYSNIKWSIKNDTLITPEFNAKIIELSDDSLVLSFNPDGTKYTEIWKKIAI